MYIPVVLKLKQLI